MLDINGNQRDIVCRLLYDIVTVSWSSRLCHLSICFLFSDLVLECFIRTHVEIHLRTLWATQQSTPHSS